MSAVIKIFEMSASLSGTDKTSSTARFKLADNALANVSDPLTIPSSGVVVSYSKQVRVYCATAPSIYIDNLLAYSDGTNSFGAGISVTASNYSASCGNPHVFVANHRSTLTASYNLFGMVAGTPIDLDAIHTASVNATGFCGDILVMHMIVDNTAAPGASGTETLTIGYDEV